MISGIERAKEKWRDARGTSLTESLFRDLHFAVRSLRKNLGFTAAAILTLALGIGANTAIFSVIENKLLHPVPWKDPQRILGLCEVDPGTKQPRLVVSPANFLDWRAQTLGSAFEYVAAWNFTYVNLRGGDQPEQVEALAVTADYFRLLGFEAGLGRTFVMGDDQPGHPHTVILSHDFWRRRFGSESSLIGQTLQINGDACAVIGILPANFHIFRVLGHEIELYVPLQLDAAHLNRAENSVMAYARLKKEVSLARAQSHMDAIYRGLAQEYPATNAGLGTRLIPLPQQWTVGVRQTLLLLLAAVCVVLLIGCSNVAGLLLARGAARHREIAVRIALGAGRFRLIRQFQTECLLLAFGGGAAGLLLAYGTLTLLNRTRTLSSVEDFRLDAPVLAFALGISVLSSVIFGVVPALQCSQISPAGSLNASARTLIGSTRGQRLRNSQIVVEVALAMVLLVGASLVLQSALRLELMNRGVNVKNVLTMQVWLPQKRYADGRAVGRFYQQVLARIRMLPGVESASAANFPPLAVQSTGVHFTTEEHPPSVGPSPNAPFAKVSVITPDYLKTMGIPLLAGRDFSEQDADENRGVVIISEATARRFWPGRDAIGSQLWPNFPKVHNFYEIESGNRPLAVVGVVGDIRQDGTADPAGLPQIYVPYQQNPSAIMSLLVRTERNPLDWVSAVRSQVWSIDKEQPVWNVRTMDDVVAETFSLQSAMAKLISIFAATALMLASVGIYGVISFSVTQRVHEIGLRMALGAENHEVFRMVIGQGLWLALVGLAIGAGSALILTRVMSGFSHLLYGVGASDPLTFVAVSVALSGVAVIACYLPARRAMRVDPMVALRYE